MNHSYKTRGTCSSRIDFELDGVVFVISALPADATET